MKIDQDLIDYLGACAVVLLIWGAALVVLMGGDYGLPLFWGLK